MMTMADIATTMTDESQCQVHDVLRRRWSPRAFDARPVEQPKLRSVLEAARWAPSANNSQPWRFIVATADDREAHARLLGTLMDGNVRWARSAPVLILVTARITVDQEGNKSQRAYYDAGLAVAQLATQATAMGLVTHQMGGFYADRAREVYHIPAEYEPIAVIAFGYQGDPAQLPEDLRARETAPRSRMPLDEIVYGGRWGETSSVAA